MWLLLLLSAASCPPMQLVASSAGLAGIKAGQASLLYPEQLEPWLGAGACPVTLWVQQELPVPSLPKRITAQVKRFKREDSSIIREDRYLELPEAVRRTYPRSALNEPVVFIATELDQPVIQLWTGPPYTLIPTAQTELTPPYLTVRSSKLTYQSLGFTPVWSRQQAWIALGGWPLPVRFIEDGHPNLAPAPLRVAPPPLEVKSKPCTSLELVTDARGLTGVDGPKATPLPNVAAAQRWVKALRSRGCARPLTWWHPEGTPPPIAFQGAGPSSFATFAPGLPTWWGEPELRSLPGELLESSGVSPEDLVVRVRIKVPMLSVCADPNGPDWRPPPPFMARLELQELRVEAPFAVIDPARLRWGGLESTSGRCTPKWEEREVLLRLPPTALPIRLAN